MTTLPAVIPIDAQALIAQAIDKGADISVLERMVALAKDMQAIAAKQAFHEAFVAFQRECPPIKKTKSADIRTRTGSRFAYRYSPLEEIDSVVKPVLAKHDLVITWRQAIDPVRGAMANCVVSHVRGHAIESGEVWMPIETSEGGSGAGPAQRVGIASTYARRYSLCAVLGITPEDDEDASSQHDPPPRSEPEPVPPIPPVVSASEFARTTEGATRVTAVDRRTSKATGKVFHVVKFEDGREGTTFDDGVVGLAETSRQAGALIIPALETKGRYTNLVWLKPVTEDPAWSARQEPEEEDVPF